MADRKTIQKIKKGLKYKDALEISRRSGLSTVTVSGFFNGKHDKMTEETQSSVIDAAIEVIKERKDREAAEKERVNALLS